MAHSKKKSDVMMANLGFDVQPFKATDALRNSLGAVAVVSHKRKRSSVQQERER